MAVYHVRNLLAAYTAGKLSFDWSIFEHTLL